MQFEASHAPQTRDYMQQRNNAVYQQRWQDHRAMPGCSGENTVLTHPQQTRTAVENNRAQNGSAYAQHQFAGASGADDGGVVSALTGQRMPTSEFTHNNMVPFFGSNIRQSTDVGAHTTRMQMHTGTMEHVQAKQEISPMFDSQKDMSFVNGTPSQPEADRDRFYKSSFRQGEKPFQDTRVGPGLAQGFTSKPSGGFNQTNARDYAMPKTVDELRTATNPKVSYTAPVVKGKAQVLRRGVHGEMAKNRPDRHFKNSPARYMTTVGAVTGNRHRSQPVDKRCLLYTSPSPRD